MEKHELIEKLLTEQGIATKVLVFQKTTRTSVEAARQVGCSVGQIAKSIVFKLTIGKSPEVIEEPVLVIASGTNRISEEKLSSQLRLVLSQTPPKNKASSVVFSIEKADADFVYEQTGFPIGGVPAFGHKKPIKYVFLDKDLLQYPTVWSAAGSPFAVYEITPQDLIKISRAQIAEIKE